MEDARYRYVSHIDTTRHRNAASHDKRDMKCGGDTRGHAQTLHFTMINVIPDSISSWLSPISVAATARCMGGGD
jgi:hypothetical protein